MGRPRPTSLLAIAAGVGLLLGLAGCGGGGDDVASPGTTVAPDPNGSTPKPPPPRKRLPGPPGPTGPGEILEAIQVWHPLAEAGVPSGTCKPLLDSVRGKLGSEAGQVKGGAAYVALYRGIAEGCLGQLQSARASLEAARDVGLRDDISGDPTCNAQQLLAFGFEVYLSQTISPRCPPTTTKKPTTTEPPTETTTDGPPTTRTPPTTKTPSTTSG